MKLGNHTIGIRRRVPRLDGDGQPVRNPIGAPIVDTVDVKVRWCQVSPTTRSSENDEPEDRAAPMTRKVILLAPRGTAITADDVVVWPITGEVTTGGVVKLSGPVHQVDGEPGLWDHALEVQLRKAT